jgi:hypothetical protein
LGEREAVSERRAAAKRSWPLDSIGSNRTVSA